MLLVHIGHVAGLLLRSDCPNRKVCHPKVPHAEWLKAENCPKKEWCGFTPWGSGSAVEQPGLQLILMY